MRNTIKEAFYRLSKRLTFAKAWLHRFLVPNYTSVFSFKEESGVIAVVDAIGIKGSWLRSEPQEIMKAWAEVVAKLGQFAANKCRITAFSDTIIVTLPMVVPYRGIPLMGEIIMVPFILALINGIFLRGIISIGKFYQSESIIIGPAIDEAMDWYSLADWIGISLAPSAHFGLERVMLNRSNVDLSRWFVKYEIPYKSGARKGWALAWPKRCLEIEVSKEKGAEVWRKVILETFAAYPTISTVVSKYDNTLLFFDKITSQK